MVACAHGANASIAEDLVHRVSLQVVLDLATPRHDAQAVIVARVLLEALHGRLELVRRRRTVAVGDDDAPAGELPHGNEHLVEGLGVGTQVSRQCATREHDVEVDAIDETVLSEPRPQVLPVTRPLHPHRARSQDEI
jgi:hypothetical protein